MGIINVDKFSRLQYITFKNILKLQEDAITLFRIKSYGTAFFISTIAQEELGKVFLIDDLIYRDNVNELSIDAIKEYYISRRMFFNHRYKQIKSLELQSPFFDKTIKNIAKNIQSGKQETEKQKALYVGLEKNNYKGRIQNPMATTRKQAATQINTVTGLLIEVANLKIAQAGLFDGLYIDNLITRRLLRKLKEVASLS